MDRPRDVFYLQRSTSSMNMFPESHKIRSKSYRAQTNQGKRSPCTDHDHHLSALHHGGRSGHRSSFYCTAHRFSVSRGEGESEGHGATSSVESRQRRGTLGLSALHRAVLNGTIEDIRAASGSFTRHFCRTVYT